jgi:C-terminal processing protease CtpA/Prc
MFLDKGQVIVSTKGRNPKNNHEYLDIEPKLCSQPLIVLVNKGSASASEIFAGAMKDTGRGLIMGPAGKTTFGKGSVQTISQLRHSMDHDENGNALPSDIRLTTAKYYTPSGESIHEKGITPDIGIELPPNHERELQQHGLIGDPNRIEKKAPAPASEDGSTTGTEDGSTTETQEKKEDKPHPLETLTKKPEDQKEEETFRDILLDEAIKYMKAVLILDKRAA